MRSLDICNKCHVGRMLVYRTARTPKGWKTRYLKCDECAHTGKEMVRAIDGDRQRRRKTVTRLVSSAQNVARSSGRMHHVLGTPRRPDERTRKMLRDIFSTAKALNIHWQDCRDWIEFGYMPAPIIVAGRLRFRQIDLDAWVEAGCPRSAEISDEECSPFWDALLFELEEVRSAELDQLLDAAAYARFVAENA